MICKKKEICLWFLIFLVFIPVYTVSINRPLRDAESKYAEIPKEMLVTGDWITPHLDYVSYYTKPPLTFWVTALAYKIFGIHPWVARITNICWAFIAALLTGILAHKMFGSPAGPIASIIFLLTSEVYAYCLDAGIEFGVISCNIASLIFFWLYYNTNNKKQHNRLYLRLFYISLGLSFLAKGLLGLALPLIICLLYCFISNHFLKKLKGLIDLPGISLFLFLTVPWIMLISIKHPDFLKCFIINEHFGRLIGTLDSQDSLFPTWLFLAHVIGEFFPWIIFSPFIGQIIISCWKHKENERKKIIYLIVWSLTPLLLFCISKCKVDFYGLHVYPPLFIILSVAIKDMFISHKKITIKWWKYSWLLLSIIAISCYFILRLKNNMDLIASLNIPSIKIARQFLITSFVFTILMFFLLFNEKIKIFFFFLSFYMVSLFFFIKEMYIADYNKDSIKFAADIYNRYSNNKIDDLILSEELPEFAHIAILPFYTGRPAYLLRNQKDSRLNFMQKERMKMCLDEKDFLSLVHKGIKIYFVGNIKKTEKRFKHMGIKYTIIGKNDDRALFKIN